MPKRTIDSNTFSYPELKSLTPEGKLFFFFYTCECDHAGIWLVDWDLFQFRTKLIDLDIEAMKKELQKLIIPINDGQMWFMPLFIKTQYGGKLKKAVKCHYSVINTLSKHKELKNELYNFIEGFANPSETLTKPLANPYIYIDNNSNNNIKDITLTKPLANPSETLSKSYNAKGIQFEIKQLKTEARPAEEICKLENMLKSEYYVNGQTIHSISRMMEEEFHILLSGLKSSYGARFVNDQIKKFEVHHMQNEWKDLHDLRHHLSNFIKKHYELKGSNSKGTAKTAQLHTGKAAAEYENISW